MANSNSSSTRLATPLSLRANFSWTFIGNMVYAACQWGMLMVLAKLGTPEMVGQFSLGLAVTAPVIMFANLQLRGVQATDAKREYEFGDYLALRIISTLLALVVIAGIVLFSGYRTETALVILTIGLAKAFEAMSDVYYGLFQQRERMDRIAQSMMIKGPISLLAMSLGVWLTGSVVWGAIGLATMWGLLLLLYDMRSARLIQRVSAEAITLIPRWQRRTLAQLAWLALPLGIVMALISLNSNIPRYMIESRWGEATLGIYAALAYLMVAGGKVTTALGQSASPRLSQYYAAHNTKAFKRLLLRLVGIGTLLGIGAVLVSIIAGKTLLTLFYTPEYAAQNDVFVLLMVASGLSYVASFLGYGMTAARYFRAQAPLFVVVVATTGLTSLWLIPQHGLHGAAFALMASLIVQIVGSAGIVLHALNQNPAAQENPPYAG